MIFNQQLFCPLSYFSQMLDLALTFSNRLHRFLLPSLSERTPMSQDQDALVSLNTEVWLSHCGKFIYYSCLMAWHPCLLRRDDVVPVTSLPLQVLLQKALWPPLVDLPSLSRFFILGYL